MNLFLRPLEDPNGVTWSIIWCLVILLSGVAYYIYTIMKMAYAELEEDENDHEKIVFLLKKNESLFWIIGRTTLRFRYGVADSSM